MPLKEGGGPPVLVLGGEDYYSGKNKFGKLGHRIDLYPQAAKPARILKGGRPILRYPRRSNFITIAVTP
jgi:hypothetical protein